jgi:single-strand DNA-binding protein
MASLNKVFLIGNLTRDPEVRYLSSGMAVADLRMAVSRKYKTQQGEEKEDVCYVNVSVWGKQGENCGQYLSKGSPAMIEGRLRFEEWEKDGQKHNRLSVTAERVQFLGAPRGKSQDSSGDSHGGPPSEEPPPPSGDSDDIPF